MQKYHLFLIALLGSVWMLISAPSDASRPITARSHGHALNVGPGRTYATPQEAYDAASPGDLIRIYANGPYQGDDAKLFISGKDDVTFRGVEGRPHMKLVPGNRPTYGKGIWVVHADNITIDNIEFSGARLTKDKNGAGIRVDPVTNVTIRNCYFHDNDEGILSSPSPQSHVLIENNEFSRNGHGDGYSHNVYVDDSILTFRYNYSHDVTNGHLLKTRAHVNYIEYNRIMDGSNPNYVSNINIDIPDGGVAYVIGNVVEQGAYLDSNVNNNSLLAYGEEHHSRFADNALYVVNNTFVNNASSGRFLYVPNNASLSAVNRNNIYTGAGTVQNGQANWNSDHNYRGYPGYADAGSYDYHLKRSTSPAVDAGVEPGSGNGYDLKPEKEYVHVAGSKGRFVQGGAIDLGAFEVVTANYQQTK